MIGALGHFVWILFFSSNDSRIGTHLFEDALCMMIFFSQRSSLELPHRRGICHSTVLLVHPIADFHEPENDEKISFGIDFKASGGLNID